MLAALLLLGTVLSMVSGQGLTLNARNTGWYDSDGNHSPTNNNYFCGFQGTAPPLKENRNFMVFDLSTVGTTIFSAQIRLVNPSAINLSGNIYTLRSVSTPISTLVQGGTGLVTIFNDLNAGVMYAQAGASTMNPYFITLNSAAVSALNSVRGRGMIAFGGKLSGGSVQQYMFGSSGNSPTDVQLILNSGPPPPPTPPTPPSPPTPAPPTPPPPPPRSLSFGVSGAITSFSFSSPTACRDFAVSIIANTTCDSDSSGCFNSANEVVVPGVCTFSANLLFGVNAIWNIYVGRTSPRPFCVRNGNICFDSGMAAVSIRHVDERNCLSDYLALQVTNAKVTEHCRNTFAIDVAALPGGSNIAVIGNIAQLTFNNFRVGNAPSLESEDGSE